MAALSPTVILEFCKLCNWAYEAWITHRALFDDNPNIDAMMKAKCGHFLSRLSIITQEYALHQIVKLHDRAVDKSGINLTFDYVINYGGWEHQTDSQLRQLYGKLDTLAKSIRPARNKILSHNDLATILNATSLGPFVKDADREYFELLQEFVNIIHYKTIGGLYPFNDIAKNDAEILLNTIQKDGT